jgi:hypothetical protein
MPFVERLPFILLAVGILLVLIVFPLYLLFGGLRTFALKPLHRCFDGIGLHQDPQPGDVLLVYHTYRGLLLWVTQDEHRVLAPAADAERLLGRLLRFNLTWGMLSCGLLFIPFLAVGNYYAQRRSIREQSNAAGCAGPVAEGRTEGPPP